ncbi:hypothetical protein HZB89_01925 [archaeon]|nr:hypothetical protein [archaeon]
MMLMKRGCRIYFVLKGNEEGAVNALGQINKLAFTDFSLSKESYAGKLLRNKKIKGIIHPASSIDESMQAFNSLKNFNLPVYFPLLLVPMELINSFEERFFNEVV